MIYVPWLSLWLNKKEEDIRREDFPTGEDRDQFFIFSPFMAVEETPMEQYLLYLVALKLMKTPEGLKVLRDLGVQYLKTMGTMIGELEGATAANWSVALVNQMTAVRVYRRLGMLSNAEAAKLSADYLWLWDKLFIKGLVVDSLAGLSSLVRSAAPVLTAAKTE